MGHNQTATCATCHREEPRTSKTYRIQCICITCSTAGSHAAEASAPHAQTQTQSLRCGMVNDCKKYTALESTQACAVLDHTYNPMKTIPKEPQAGPERPRETQTRETQGSPGMSREAQGAPEGPRETHGGGPGTPREAQGDPGKPRETKGSPRRPREAQEGPGTRKRQGAPGRPRDSHRDPRFPQVLVGLLYYLGASGATIAMPWRRLSPWLPSIATCNRAIDPPETRVTPPRSWHIHPINAPPFSYINAKTIGQGRVPLHPNFKPSNLIHSRWLDIWKHVC